MSGPHLLAAMLCERGGDSARMVEELDRENAVPLALVVVLARGEWEGSIPVHVVASAPSEEPIARIDIDTEPAPEPHATSRIVVPIELDRMQAGVYWFDVVIGETAATRVPLLVR